MTKTSTFTLPSAFREMSHRERILAKRELYGAHRRTDLFINADLFTDAGRRRARLPHQGNKECARRAAMVAR